MIGNGLILILVFLVYFITFFCVVKFKLTYDLRHENFPTLKMKKSGISFVSTSTHRIKITNIKTKLIGKTLYLKTTKTLIIITNVKDVKIYNQFLYFTCLGRVQVFFDCKEFYQYFVIIIKSDQFDINELKQSALINLANNGFDINFSDIAKKYVNIIKKVLNINIFDKKITIKQNKFKFSFELVYKANNKIKKVIID